MRSVSAIILLVAFAALFIEAVKLPVRCETQFKSKCALMMKMHPNCKMLAKMVKHNEKKGKCDSRDCPDCPLCAVTIFNGMIAFSMPAINKIEYSVMLNNNLSDYNSRQWKPPNS